MRQDAVRSEPEPWARLGIVAAAIALIVSLATPFARPVSAQARAIEGVWAVSATGRDCVTNATLGPPIRSLLTFDQGGTVTESAALLLFAPGQRSIGHGLWARAGVDTFVERVAAMILFDTPPAPPSPGFQAGWTLSTQTIGLSDANNFTSAGDVVFYNINRQPYRRLCASRVGERLR